VGAVGLVLAVPGWSMSPNRRREFVSERNPLAVEALPTDALLAVGMTLFLGALLASAVSLVVRFRRSVGEERHDHKPLRAQVRRRGNQHADRPQRTATASSMRPGSVSRGVMCLGRHPVGGRSGCRAA